MTKIAFVGTGFVADYYMKTLGNHPGLELVLCWDRNAERLARFSRFHGVDRAGGLEDILTRADIDIVANLTNPQSHYTINRVALEAGKHVYCEKPLAMTGEEARGLGEIALSRNRTLHSAPANAFCPAFVRTAEILRGGLIGAPRMVYAEMEDGPVFWKDWQEWRSESGAPWPGLHEFETGCTLEHAGYALSWLLALFGPVRHMTASTQLVFPDKGPGKHALSMAPDLTVGLLTFDNSVHARLSCGLASERNRSLTIMAQKGTLTIADLWDWNSEVRVQTRGHGPTVLQRAASWVEWKRGRVLPMKLAVGQLQRYRGKQGEPILPGFPSRIDFAAGLQAQADAIRSGRPGFFSGDVSVHMTEVTLALQAGTQGFEPETDFSPELFRLEDWPESLRSAATPR